MNLYNYVSGNPVNAVDPWGLVDINLHNPNHSDPGQAGLYTDQQNYSSPDGRFTVGGHGNSAAMADDRGNGRLLLTPQQLAKEIYNNPGYKCQDVQLMSCETGKGNNSFAQQVASELKRLGCCDVTVYAPNDYLGYNTNMDKNGNITQRPSVDNGGSFVPFKGR